MSKNFVRGIDGINNINKQDFNTNKPNDLLSTKEHNYIRKETEQYHCLTDNVKQTKATNVRYTDTTASPNVNYNLLSVDNSQVPKTNTNTISAASLVEALEAKDSQIQELKDKIDKLNPETQGETLDALLYTSSSGENGEVDGFLTVKTITLFSEDNEKRVFIVDFRFCGKLARSYDGTNYHTSININNLKGLWANLTNWEKPLELVQFMTFVPSAYDNGLETPTFANFGGNELAFDHDGSQTDDTISTTTTFTLKATVRK